MNRSNHGNRYQYRLWVIFDLYMLKLQTNEDSNVFDYPIIRVFNQNQYILAGELITFNSDRIQKIN